jgi:hypothetical protein
LLASGIVVAALNIAIEHTPKGATPMQLSDLARYGLWCGIAATAAGNRREYAMTTAWLPHLLTNSASLLLPDLLRHVEPAPLPASADAAGVWPLLRATLDAMVRDNPAYVLYVAPLAAGYLLSAPWLNIYKGKLGDRRVAGFGLDALPHAATAFALTAFSHKALQVAASLAPDQAPLAPPLRRLAERRDLASALVLALATLLWELGECRIYRHELSRRGDDSAINMQWSPLDTASDCLANAAGWLLAVGLERVRAV